MPTALLEKQDMPKTYQEAKDAGLPVFKFFTDGPAKAAAVDDSNGGDGSPKILLTASTNVTDLAGDAIQQSSMEQMRDAAVGTTIFLNHSFDVPQDVFGVVAKADLVERLDPKTKQPYLCLDYIVEVEMSNPAAAKTYEIIKNGKVKLGASITVLILDAERLKDGTQSIVSVYYLETSIVGLPMNQSSWVRQAVKALKWMERNQPATVAVVAEVKTKTIGNSSKDSGKQQHRQLPVKVKKGISKMQDKKIVQKNAFDEVMANGASSTCQDLCSALCGAIDTLLGQADGGDIEDPLGTLKELLSDFEDAVLAHVKPALKALAEPDDDDDESSQDSDGAGSGGSGDDGGTDQSASYSIEKAREFFVWKTIDTKKLTSKSEADDLVDGGGSAEDAGPWQEIHDVASSKGATCMGMGDGSGDDNNMTSASFDPKKIRNAAVKGYVLELQNKYDEMAEAAEAATLALEVFLKQPLI
jgi:hypothetical protein